MITPTPANRCTCQDFLDDGDLYRVQSEGCGPAFLVGSLEDLLAIDGSEYGLGRAIRRCIGEGDDSYSEIVAYATA